MRHQSDNTPKQSLSRDQLLTVADMEDFKAAIIEDIKQLLLTSSGQSVKQWLRSSEVRKMLGISAGTLQNLRVKGSLPYTKIGGIVFYRYDDLDKLLNSK
jgi:hypothetical protein